MLKDFGLLWPDAIRFSVIVVMSLLAFGLYDSRQRAQLSRVRLARLELAVLVSACAIFALFALFALFYIFPSRIFPSRLLFRGIEALMVVMTVCVVLVRAASNPRKDVRRQLSLRPRAPTPKSKNSYLLLFALAATLAILVLLGRVS